MHLIRSLLYEIDQVFFFSGYYLIFPYFSFLLIFFPTLTALRSLLRELDETSDSREICYMMDNRKYAVINAEVGSVTPADLSARCACAIQSGVQIFSDFQSELSQS